MYARNNANPLPVLVGTITQISDGVVQTAGVSVNISKDNGAYVAGANTPTVEQGEWSYTPSQAETDCSSLRVVLYKTGCYSRSIQVVFTASDLFGYAGTDQSKIANPAAIVDLTNTTIGIVTDVTTKSGYSLSSAGITAIFATLTNTLATVGSVGKLIVDNLNAAVGSIPTNPLLTNDSRLNFLDASIAQRATQTSVDALPNTTRNLVMNSMPNGGWVNGSFGDRWVIGVNNNREVQVTESNHISADVHAMQNNTITNNALAASAITEIQSGLSTLTSAGIRDAIGLASNNLDTQLSNISGFIDTEISSIKTAVDKLDTALELDGSVYRFTTNALELAPTATDWTTDERAAIRAIFGIPTSGTSPVDPSSGILDTIRDLVVIVDSVTDAIEVDTQNIQSRIPASLIGGRIVANAEIVGDKTGYSLTQAFPTNFASLGINASGHISRVTLVDTTTTNTDMITASGIRSSIGLASANLDSQLSTIAGYIDTEIGSIKAKTDQMVFTTAGRLDTTAVAVLDKTGYTLSQAFPTNFSSLNINIDGKVLLQPTQTGVTIPTVTSITNFVGVSSIGTNVITSDVLATSAVDEIRSGLALETTSQSILSGVNTLTSRITAGVANMFQDLIAMIQGTGTGLVKWTATALSLAPSGGGGGGGNVTVNANILPIQSYMRKRIESETISLFYNESTDIFITLEDENGPIDVTGKTLEFVIETKNKTNLIVISNGNIAKSSTGASVRISTEVTANVGTYLWALRDLTGGDTVLSHGFAEVSYAPKS